MKKKISLSDVLFISYLVLALLVMATYVSFASPIAEAFSDHDMASCVCSICIRFEPYCHYAHFEELVALGLMILLVAVFWIVSFCFEQAYWLYYRDILERYNLRHPEPELQIEIPKRNKDLRKLKEHINEYWHDYRLGFAYRDYYENFQKK